MIVGPLLTAPSPKLAQKEAKLKLVHTKVHNSIIKGNLSIFGVGISAGACALVGWYLRANYVTRRRFHPLEHSPPLGQMLIG